MKKPITFLLAVIFMLAATAQSVVSPVLRSALEKSHTSKVQHAWVTLNGASVGAVSDCGVKVESGFDDMLLVSGDALSIQRVAQLQGVKGITAPSHLKLHCDSARSYTNASWLLQGKGFDTPYTGRGVVVGMIDCGIDYQHMAFKDANGVSRISRVYHPAEQDGTVFADGEYLPGKEYTTPEQIATLITDDKTMGHGCHTTGIAAGSTVGNYGGLAPEAEIAIVGIPNAVLEDYNVILGMRYIASYAASVGKPCVINISMGNHDGPHDGTGTMARVIDELYKKYGTIFVLSSGNEAGTDMYLHKTLDGKDNRLSSMMMINGTNNAVVDIWSRDGKPLSIELGLFDYKNGRVMCTTSPIVGDSTFVVDNDSEWSQYSSGEIRVHQGVDPVNGHYRIFVEHEVGVSQAYGYITFTVTGESGSVIDVWDVNGNANFASGGVSMFADGNDIFSISDMATGDYSISVGACAARDTYPVSGRTTTNGYYIGMMARYSSYGTDLRGQVHPFIVAPGISVVSSVSGLNCSKSTYSQRMVDAAGKYHYWYVKSGTSMAAPSVTGIVAQWLQACPSASLGQIKEAIAQTAVRHADGDPKRGPNGDIDAAAGLHYLLEHSGYMLGDVNGDGVVDIADVNTLINVILGDVDAQTYGRRAYVNDDDVVDIADVNAVINIILGI